MAKPNEPPKQKQELKQKRPEPELEESLVRILGYDIPGSRNTLSGLTRIKGVGWAIANLTCIKLNLDKKKKILDLSKPEIEKIESFVKNLDAPDFLKNRRNDLETGETKHYSASDLEMKKDFDIRRLKKIRSYKGIRHTSNLPVRGQRTRSNFRAKGSKAVGVKKKKVGKKA
jgi:small subunit ribosomal protein S13